jgi:hypothetical protein
MLYTGILPKGNWGSAALHSRLYAATLFAGWRWGIYFFSDDRGALIVEDFETLWVNAVRT